MGDKVRVLRILEYVGDREWIEDTLKRGSVPTDGIKDLGNGNMIKSALIDKFPEIINKTE